MAKETTDKPEPDEIDTSQEGADTTSGADIQDGGVPDDKPTTGNNRARAAVPPTATAIAESKAAKRIKRLESDIAGLQDVLGKKQSEIDDLQSIVGAAATKPGKEPGKTVLDELNDFLGV
jgi:hypothetical protein